MSGEVGLGTEVDSSIVGVLVVAVVLAALVVVFAELPIVSVRERTARRSAGPSLGSNANANAAVTVTLALVAAAKSVRFLSLICQSCWVARGVGKQ